MRMLGNAIVHENKTSDVKVRVSVEREELDKLIKDMDRVNWLANETYEKIRKMSKIKLQKKSDETKNWTEKVADRRLEEIGCRI